MAEEVLTPAELEILFSAGEQSRAAAESASRPAPDAKSFVRGMPETPADPHRAIAAYDFRNPARLGLQQLQALRAAHEGLGRNLGVALSALLRAAVEVKLVSVDQVSYGEFISGLGHLTCFNLLRAASLETRAFFEINPSILFPFIDRLLGGPGHKAAVARRPLTEIELRLVARITAPFLEQLCKVWQGAAELQFSVQRVESTPQDVQFVPPTEMMLVTRFESTMNDARGLLNLCIPFHVLRGVIDQQLAGRWPGLNRPTGSLATSKHVGDSLRQSVVELVAHLAETKITSGDVFDLRVGDIITTEKEIHGPLSVAVEGVMKFRAHVGAFKGRKAVQIEEVVDPASD